MSHLTGADRCEIEHALHAGISLQEIADKLKKARSTILREVLKHRKESGKVSLGRIPNSCIHRRNCTRHDLCPGRRCHRQCSVCANCNEVCPDYQEEKCSELTHAPYVCNGCHRGMSCTLRKFFYIFDSAEGEYRRLLADARKGANLTPAQKDELNVRLCEGIRKGQSIHHIMSTSKDSFTVCEKTVYGYVNEGILRVKRGDMPKSCMMKPRRTKAMEHKVDPRCRTGRSYDDFKSFSETHSDFSYVEMDSVVGKVGGKVLLTMQLNNCGLLLAFLRDCNNSQSVIDIFNRLENMLGLNMFQRLFPVILTDNGTEFSNPEALEASIMMHGERRTRIFYCTPYSAWQKGHVENNHLNLRKILEKGTSFDQLEQNDIDLIMSHLNSYARKSLNDIPAASLFETLYGKDTLRKLNIRMIPPTEIQLTPDLLMKP